MAKRPFKRVQTDAAIIKQRVIYHWHIDTAHFTFDAYGGSAGECARVMREAWTKHQANTGATATFSYISEGGSPNAVILGSVYRDRSFYHVG